MRLLYLFIIGLLASSHCWAQFQDPVKFSVEKRNVSDSEFEVVFNGTIENGWHVYGVDIADGGPTRAELTLERQTGVKPVGRLKAEGNVHRGMDPIFGMEVSYLEGKAVFVQRFQITAEKYDVAGYLTYGACNDQSCMPPSDVEFAFQGEGKAVEQAEQKTVEEQPAEKSADVLPADSTTADTASAQVLDTSSVLPDLWTPVIDELRAFSQDDGVGSESEGRSLWLVFLLGLLGGLAALVTPCVWPIIPMTVSFFLKRSKDDRGQGIRDAVIYGLSIVVIYVSLGLLVTLLFGASALNSLATNAVFNIFFFLLLVVFGASFLGGFEITLPSSWSNAVDGKAHSSTGLLSIFLMAFTLALVSFSCTGPIIGFLLVEVSTSGSIVAPTIGMLGFAIALALPFTLFALFPQMMKKAPKSGNWMNVMKVTLGFIELAFSLKFLSVADLAYGWHLLDRETFLCLWIILFALLGAYLIGWIRFPHDEDEYDEMGEKILNPRTSVVRFFMAVVSFAFALYMVPGLWGAPCKAVSAFASHMSTLEFYLSQITEQPHFFDYEEGMAYAREHHKPVLLDFTGYGCVNCRKMEAAVWTDEKVDELISEKYVLISLYVDEKQALPQPITVMENGRERHLRTVGDKWSYLQRVKFGANAQPFYVLATPDGEPLNAAYSYDEDVDKYLRWLQQGLLNY